MINFASSLICSDGWYRFCYSCYWALCRLGVSGHCEDGTMLLVFSPLLVLFVSMSICGYLSIINYQLPSHHFAPTLKFCSLTAIYILDFLWLHSLSSLPLSLMALVSSCRIFRSTTISAHLLISSYFWACLSISFYFYSICFMNYCSVRSNKGYSLLNYYSYCFILSIY